MFVPTMEKNALSAKTIFFRLLLSIAFLYSFLVALFFWNSHPKKASTIKMAEDEPDDLSAAIRNFISGQQPTPPPTPPQQPEPQQRTQRQQQQPHPEPEPEPEPQPQPQAPPRPRPPTRHQENTQITFVYNGEELHLPENDATPTAVADHFELEREEIQLQRNDRTYTIHASEDRFKPNLRGGKSYTVTKIPTQRPQPTQRRGVEQRQQNSSSECTLIANVQHKSITAGSVRRGLISQTFRFGRQVQEIRLIEQDGNVIENKQLYDLTPGATYHVIYSSQDMLENDNDDDIDDSGEPFRKPMAFIAPFMIATVRILYALSLTGDSVIFTSHTLTPTASEKETKSKLLCSNKLSTCAFQVAFRFNTALKIIQKLSSILNATNAEEKEEPRGLFEHQEECEEFCHELEKVVQTLEKAHDELEEFLQIVLKEMRAINPSVKSVKTSLKAETNQEIRIHEKEEMVKIDPKAFFEKCDAIYDDDREIRPANAGLQTISSNRTSLNFGIKLVETILDKLDDSAVLEDITNLLDFCAKISHCNLMHWLFTLNLFKTVNEYYKQAELPNTVEFRKKIYVAKHTCYAIEIWNIISRGVPLAANLNEEENETTDIHEIWGNLKDAIISSQYALEICHDIDILNSQ